jgi:hypothetical protein
MAGYADIFAACFAPSMPGVVTATWGNGQSAQVQWFEDVALEDNGLLALQRRQYRMQGLSADLAALERNTTVTVAGVTYRTVTIPLADAFGVSEIYLESL